MSSQKRGFYDGSFILRAALAWFICALVLLTAASFTVNGLMCGEGTLGYISSALSFLTAVAAGAAASARRSEGALYTAALTAAVLVVALLTVGFVINGADMDPSSVLSVVSFSFAGCLAGAVIFGGARKKKAKKRIPTRMIKT